MVNEKKPRCHLQQPDDTTTSPLTGQPPVKSVMRHIFATDGREMLPQDHGTLVQSSPRLRLVLQCTRTKTTAIKCPLNLEPESFQAASHS